MTSALLCGNTTFWDDDIFTKNIPKFTTCFLRTVPVLVPTVWLILSFLIYVIGLPKVSTSLPIRTLNIFKTGICILLALLGLFDIYLSAGYINTCLEDGEDEYSHPSYLVVSVLNFTNYIYVGIVTQINRRRGIVSSWMLWIFWLLSLLSGLLPLQDNILYRPMCLSSITNYISFGLVCIQLVLYSQAEHFSVYGYQRIGKDACPQASASVVSKLFISWFTPIVVKCYKQTITKDDLWDQHPDLQAEKLTNELYTLWTAEQKSVLRQRLKDSYSSKYSKNWNIPGEETSLLEKSYSGEEENHTEKKTPSLSKCCLRLFGWEWFSGAFLKLFCDAAALLQPQLLRLIIKETEKPGEDRILWYGIVLAVLLYIAGQMVVTFYIHSSQKMLQLGLKVKTALIGVIYRKTLKVSSSVRKDYTVGEVVNLVSVDCQRIQDAFTFSNELLSFFLIQSVGIYEIWDVMGPSALGCVAVMICISLLNVFFGKLQQGYLLKVLYDKGKRCKLLNEVICGMKVIKMYAWESFFAEKLKEIRRKEMKILHKLGIITACTILSSLHTAFMMNFSILLIYTLTVTTEVLDAEKAFLALTVVNVMRFDLAFIPYVITGFIQAVVSLKRIQHYLLTDDVNENNVQRVTSSNYAVSVEWGSFSWEKDALKPTLSGINIKIRESALIAVVGQVGAGKTSFISSILGELEKIKGEVKIKGSVAYISQEAWIQNATVKNNILYGRAFNERKYEKVIEACCLKPDLQILSAGDMTEIGERGINLSGGQKQRINLARAVYSNSDIYLFDDPLSAVDSHVGKDIFKKVIGPDGMLRNKTRILVTHGIHWLPKVDEIIVLGNGCITENGHFEQLIQHNGPFAEFLQTYLLQESDEDDESDPEIDKIKDEIRHQIEALTDAGTSDEHLSVLSEKSRRKPVRQKSQQDSISKSEQRMSSRSKREKEKDFYLGSLSGSFESKSGVTTQGLLIKEEASQEGSVSLSVFTEYAKAMGIPTVLITFLFLMAQQGFQISCNLWVSIWTEDSYLTNASLLHTQKYEDTKYYYVGIYALLGLFQGITLFCYAYIAFTSFVRATGKIHNRSLDSVFRSPMSFFDTTPIGRIMNRFSSDIDVIDNRFPISWRTVSLNGFMLFATLIVIAVSTPFAAIALIPIFGLFIVAVRCYLPSSRQLKRIESVSRSPLFNHFSETISGASIIRAYRSVDRFIDELYRRLDLNSAFYHAANTAMGWIAVIVQSLGTLTLLAVALFGILSFDVNGADVGLALTYAFQMVIGMNSVVRAVTEMQMNVISFERVEEYMDLPSEADWIQRKRPKLDWPQKGTIQFDDYKTRYRPGLEMVLKGITFFIRSGERVGIVGRTGAGKSSLTQALFRLIEPAGGCIIIDDVTTTTIGLHDLRRKITILPQDPVLFSDTLKVNLDPVGNFSDDEIWRALECAHMKQFVMEQPGQLNAELGEGGNNLSVGQRQLVCLARTLLHKTNILILDEATAAVDMETDDLIQQTIREQFVNCTILSIAHRLSTVLDYDRIMVMDNGLIAEFDTPPVLLNNKDGIFYSMAKDAGVI